MTSTLAHELSVIQLRPGILTVARTSWTVGHSAFHAVRYSQGVQLRLRVQNRPVIGYVLSRTAAVVGNGVPLSLNDITVVRDTVLDISSLDPFGFMFVELAENVLDANDSALTAGPLVASFTGAEIRSGLPVGWAERTRQGEIGAIIRTAKRLPNSISARRRFELACHVEKLIWPNIDEPISLRRLSDVTGCSERSVIYAFKRSFGLGPISYFKVRRLNAIRESLLNGETRKAIVYVAADHGFWHLGHFGADYKAFFGETPSQTRRQARLEKRLASMEVVAPIAEAFGSVRGALAPAGALAVTSSA